VGFELGLEIAAGIAKREGKRSHDLKSRFRLECSIRHRDLRARCDLILSKPSAE
jgi:hypothetical protein